MLAVRILKARGSFTLDVRFQAPTPGVVALFGRSGCGKTTTINVIAGLLAAQETRIELDGEVLEDSTSGTCVPAQARQIGYVFQDGRLFPHLSVLGNLRYGLTRAARRPAGRAGLPLEQVVELLGLQSLLTRRPWQLSGGERQRVGLGRALLSQPRLLLLDEPLAALDAARRGEVLPYLERLRDELSIPMVYVSHHFDEVLQLATHVVLMEAGRVISQGTLGEVSLHPALRSIVGPDAVGAVLDGVIRMVDEAAGVARLQVGDGILNVGISQVAVGQRVRVQLLARDIILAIEAPHGLSVRNQLQGRIAEITPDAEDALLVTVDVGGVSILSRITRAAGADLNLQRGQAVWALVKAVSMRGRTWRLSPDRQDAGDPES